MMSVSEVLTFPVRLISLMGTPSCRQKGIPMPRLTPRGELDPVKQENQTPFGQGKVLSLVLQGTGTARREVSML